MEPLVNFVIATDEMSIKNNHISGEQFVVTPAITRDTGITSDGKYYTRLTVAIKNTEKNPFPIDICVSMTGIFDLSNIPEDKRDEFLKVNGAMTIFPYVRSAVTNLSTTAMVTPIVLPIIDIRKTFSD